MKLSNKFVVVASIFIFILTCVSAPLKTRAQTTTFTINNPSVSTFYGQFQGFGAEWDPFFWNTNNQNRGLTQSDWNSITSRISELKPGIMRMMMQLSWAQSSPGASLNWTNPQMQSVFKYLDVACQNNIDVVLTDWGWTPAAWGVSPSDTRFAQGIANYLDEFINKRGYTCIKYLVVGNEPDNEIQKNSGQAVYEQMYRNVDQALRDKGIRNQIKLTGPDMGGQWDFMKTSISNLKDILDTYDFHRYASTEETSNIGLTGTWETLWDHLDLWRREVNSRDTSGANKLVLLTEMGNSGGSTNNHPNIDTYEYALHMADYGTTLLKTRVNAGIAWTMHDIYYFDGGQFMQWGMWKYKNDNWALRPWAQPFALLTNFAPRGSTVAAVNNTPPSTPPLSQHRVAALKRPDGKWSIFLVNRTASATTFNIVLPSAPTGPFDRYQIDRNTFPAQSNTLLVSPTATLNASVSFDVSMPAESFVVLVEKNTILPTSSPTPTPKPGDVDGNGSVTLSDLTILLSNFGKSGMSRIQGDLTGDGSVTLPDLTQLLANFGK